MSVESASVMLTARQVAGMHLRAQVIVSLAGWGSLPQQPLSRDCVIILRLPCLTCRDEDELRPECVQRRAHYPVKGCPVRATARAGRQRHVERVASTMPLADLFQAAWAQRKLQQMSGVHALCDATAWLAVLLAGLC
jgi:hypothetical protein